MHCTKTELYLCKLEKRAYVFDKDPKIYDITQRIKPLNGTETIWKMGQINEVVQLLQSDHAIENEDLYMNKRRPEKN